MVFCCSRKLDSECMEVGRSCAEKHVPNMYLTYIEKLIRQTSIHAWGTVVGLVSKQQRYAVVDITFFGLCPETLSGARNWHRLLWIGHLLNWEALFAAIFRGDLRLGSNPCRFSLCGDVLKVLINSWLSSSNIFWNTVLSRNASNFGGDFDNLAMPLLWHFLWDFQTLWRLELGLPLLERLRAAQLPVACSRILHKLAFCDVSWTKTGYKYILKLI